MVKKGRPGDHPFLFVDARVEPGITITDSSATPRRAPTRIALHARAIPHQREMPAFAAHLALVALRLGLGPTFSL
jgi:hypothetical protein